VRANTIAYLPVVSSSLGFVLPPAKCGKRNFQRTAISFFETDSALMGCQSPTRVRKTGKKNKMLLALSETGVKSKVEEQQLREGLCAVESGPSKLPSDGSANIAKAGGILTGT
jgi:hypothetical protein